MTYLTKLLLVIAAMWASQLALAYLQAKKFQADLRSLRQYGTVAIGMGGRRYRGGRAFVALAADENGLIVTGLVLRGLTVFAKSKPLNTYNGFSLADIISGTRVVLGEPKKVQEATQMAAQHIQDHLTRVEQGE
ncbi:MAG: transcriptional regulator GutM [Actinomycetes bacterium]